MRTRIGLFVFLLLLSSVLYGQSLDLGSMDWTVKKPSVKELASPNDIGSFLDYRAGFFFTVSIQWVDLDQDGSYELVVFGWTKNDLERLMIFKSVGEEKVLALNVKTRDTKPHIEDLDGDGKQEIIVERPLMEMSEMPEMPKLAMYPFWTAIYKWNGKAFEEDAIHFRNYYMETVLPRVEKLLVDLEYVKSNQKLPPNSHYSYLEASDEEIAANRLIRDRILRTVGKDPCAGLSIATEWAKSQNQALQTFGNFVLAEIRKSSCHAIPK